MTRNSGWVKLHRKIQDSPALAGNPQREFLFIKIIMNAAYEDGDDLLRGQWRTTIRELALMTANSVQSIRTHLANLQHTNCITINTLPDRGGSIITVCNYDDYQGMNEVANTPINTPTNTPTNKPYKEKKIEEVKELSLCAPEDAPKDRFDEFWEVFGYKKGKARAQKAWRKALKKTSADEIIKGAKRYKAWREANNKEVKWAEGWLNDERWDDVLDDSAQSDGSSISDEEADRLLAAARGIH